MMLVYIILAVLGIAYCKIPIQIQFGEFMMTLNTLQVLCIYLSCIFIANAVRQIQRRIMTTLDLYYKYRTAILPHQLKLVVINHILQVNKQIKLSIPDDLDEDHKLYVGLISLLINERCGSDYLIGNLDSPSLKSINNTIVLLNDCNYSEALIELNKLMRIHGLTPWIYKYMRISYLKIRDFTALDTLNHSKQFNLVKASGPYDQNEGKILILTEKYAFTTDFSKKLDLLKQINSLVPDNIDYSMKYAELLRNFGQIPTALEVLKTCWSKNSSIRLINLMQSLLETIDTKTAYDFAISLPNQDAIATMYIVIKVSIRANMAEKISEHLPKIGLVNPLVAKLIQLELAYHKNDTHLINQVMEELFQINSELIVK